MDSLVVRLPFGAAVPTVVVVRTVRIVPAVVLVVLCVIAVEVIQRKAVVAGQEVDGGIQSAVDGIIQIRRTDDPLCGDGRAAGIPFQEPAHIVPVPSVPFRPAFPGREGADLIEAAGIPCFRDQLYISKDGIKSQATQKRRLVHGGAVLVAAQDGRKVEPETVDPVLGGPVAQTVQDHLLDNRMVAVQSISAAAEIIIMAVGGQQIINIVVKAFEGKAGAHLISFGGVVEHHVQYDLHAVIMQRLDQKL